MNGPREEETHDSKSNGCAGTLAQQDGILPHAAGENALLDSYARLSGMTKQDYIIARLLQKEIVVDGNPRVYKALKDRMDAVLNELQRLNAGDHPSPETLEEIGLMTNMMREMKNGD